MIKANELRIGNWVIPVLELQGESSDYEYLPPCQVSELPITEAHKFYEPIPITPEILDKCGFEWKEHWKSYQKEKFDIEICANADGGYWCYLIGAYTEQEFSAYLCTIKHLHQLQNLYFVLTGQELEISL